MKAPWRSLLLIGALAFASPNAAEASSRYSFGLGYSGSRVAVGIGVTSRGYHHAPRYRPVCPPPRVHYRPVHRPVFWCPPPPPPVFWCPPPPPPVVWCPPVYHAPVFHSAPASSVSFGFGYVGSRSSVAFSQTTVHPVSYSQPAPAHHQQSFQPAPNVSHASSFATGPSRHTQHYAQVNNSDGRFISEEATWHRNRLVSSRTEVVDNRPAPSDLQRGTNYTNDGRLVFPAPQPQTAQQAPAQRAVDTPSTAPSSNQSTGERPDATPATTTNTAFTTVANTTGGMNVVHATNTRTMDPAIAERLERLRVQAEEDQQVAIRRVERVAVSNAAGSMASGAVPAGRR